MIAPRIEHAVREQILPYPLSALANFVAEAGGPYAIKFVQSQWAADYSTPNPLKISENPALTWGTATYVTPLAFPLSSALYGRIGLVAEFDPTNWRIFDATGTAGQQAYVQWARSQPMYSELLLTVHSTEVNHLLRNQFREIFGIDCVLFHPDQEADLHTNKADDVWMAVTDWTASGKLETKFSGRLANARFTVLLDEDFKTQEKGLPIRVAKRQIEQVTEAIGHAHRSCAAIDYSRGDPTLPRQIVDKFKVAGYLHVYIVP